MNIDPCKSCKAPMIWVRTANGKMMPLDAEPSQAGNIEIVDGVVHVIPKDSLYGGEGPLYTSHFATCPHAANFRKKSS